MSSMASEQTQEARAARAWAFVSRERGPVAMLVMAVAGIAIAAYLTTVHYAKIPLVCSTGGAINCAAVTSSRFSVVPGTQLPITIPGMLWFVVSGALAVVALLAARRGQAEPERLRLVQMLWGLAGLLFVLYLVYAEFVQLHKFCEWCTAIHLLTFFTFLIALARWQREGMEELTAASPALSRAETVRTGRGGTRYTASRGQRLPKRLRSAAGTKARSGRR